MISKKALEMRDEEKHEIQSQEEYLGEKEEEENDAVLDKGRGSYVYGGEAWL